MGWGELGMATFMGLWILGREWRDCVSVHEVTVASNGSDVAQDLVVRFRHRFTPLDYNGLDVVRKNDGCRR